MKKVIFVCIYIYFIISIIISGNSKNTFTIAGGKYLAGYSLPKDCKTKRCNNGNVKGQYVGSGCSVLPGADKLGCDCCPNGYTSIPHVNFKSNGNIPNGLYFTNYPGLLTSQDEVVSGSDRSGYKCVQCSGNGQRCIMVVHCVNNTFCENIAMPEDNLNDWIALARKNNPGSYSYGYAKNSKDFNYSDSYIYVNPNKKGANCAPVPMEVCWTNEKDGQKEYYWQAARPSKNQIIKQVNESGKTVTKKISYENEWIADFNLTTKETCNSESATPEYCYVKYGTGEDDNKYEMSEKDIEGWVKLDITDPTKCKENPLCYLNNEEKYVWGKFKNREGYTFQKSIDKAEECNSITICDPKPTPIDGIDKNANFCSEDVTKSYSSKISCDGVEGVGFYEIVCQTDVKSSFDLGADSISNDKLTLFQGQGFGFNIDVSLINNCTGKFNSETWNSTYNNFKSKRDKAVIGTNEYNRYNLILESLKEKVNAFNNWEVDKDDNPNISFNLKTNPEVNINSMDYSIKQEGEGTKTFDNTRTLSDGTSISDFTYTNKNKPKVISYYPQAIKLDKNTGAITLSNKNYIDGGNKVYTDLDVSLGEYPIDIVISNLKDNKVINNNKCSIEIIKPSSLYRIVEVTNPFVNNERKIATNWKNGNFDYTNIIDNNKNPLYTFTLKNYEIKAIKDSNNSDNNSYLGVCNRQIEYIDAVTEKICDIINNH